MFYKIYALDPSVLNNWDNFSRLYLENFGFSKGRLLLRLPKKWKKEVYDLLAQSKCSPKEKKMIEEALGNRQMFDERFISLKSGILSATWDGEEQWLNNAEQAFDILSFDVTIISDDNPRNKVFVIPIKELFYPHQDRWKSKTQGYITRNAKEMASSFALLLQNTTEIVFVDPYFKKLADRHTNTLEEFLNIAQQEGEPLKSVKYFLEYDNEGSPDVFKRNLEALDKIIPKSVKVTFYEIEKCKDLHNRHILTDRGGISIPNGLDENKNGAKAEIILNIFTQYQDTKKMYDPGDDGFDFVIKDKTVVIGKKLL